MRVKYIDKLNAILEQHQQNLRVIEYKNKKHISEISLSNGIILLGNAALRFKRRIDNKNTDLWVKNADKLYNGVISAAEIKSELAKIGGINCQKIHGEKLRKNLNTGVPWIKGRRGVNCHTHTEETKKKISLKNSGSGNGMYGRHMSDEDKQKKSLMIKRKILNGEFTPNSNNRNTHWDVTYEDKKYRSSWEALYQYLNPGAEYEVLRIEYQLYNKNYVYIVDFVDYENKCVVEVKPRELCTGDKFLAKFNALTKWANDNEFRVIIVDREWFISNSKEIDYTKFDDNTVRKIKKIYEISKSR